MNQFLGFGASDVGCVRTNNEDSFLIEESLGLFILCDGVGGENSGEVASATCVKRVRDFIFNKKNIIEDYQKKPSLPAKAALTQLVFDAVTDANEAILSMSEKEKSYEGMATTLEVLILLSDYALLGHVGDSRTYLMRSGKVHQLTEDHKFGAEMVRKGTWDAATAERSPYRNSLTRVVGKQRPVQIDLLEIELSRDDLFLICSDGFSDYFSPLEIGSFLAGADVLSLPRDLIERAKAKGGKDNITTLTIKAQPSSETKIAALDVLNKEKALNNVPLFAYFSFAELCKVLAMSKVRILKEGEVLFNETDPAEEMFVVVSGSVDVIKNGHVITTLGQGAPLGEMGIIDDSPRSATAKAKQLTTVLSIRSDELIHLLKQEAVIGVKFLWAMSQELDRKLRSTSQDLAIARSLIDEKKLPPKLPFYRE